MSETAPGVARTNTSPPAQLAGEGLGLVRAGAAVAVPVCFPDSVTGYILLC